MFDERVIQLATAYQNTVDNTIINLRYLASEFIELMKALLERLLEKLKEEKEQLSNIEVKVGSEKYRLVPDEQCPGAWKWESAKMTDFQAQTVARRLMLTEAMGEAVDIDKVQNNCSLAIIVTTEFGEKLVVYHQNWQGQCLTNLVTENLNAEEIIDIAYEIVTPNLLPPASEIIEAAGAEFTEIIDEEIEEHVVDSVASQSPETEESTIENRGVEDYYPDWEDSVIIWDENAPLPEPPEEDYPHDFSEEGRPPAESKEILALTKVNQVESNTEPQSQVNDTFQETVNNPAQALNQSAAQKVTEEDTDKSKRKSAFEYTYDEVASAKEVSPQTKNWVREVEVSIKKAVANSRAERQRQKQENTNIAKAAKEMLKVYGETNPDGSRIYRSDAFVIRQQGDKYSIHRRRDELTNFANPLMEFTENSKGKIKITIPPTQMLPVERQEFLMVAERLESGKKLPQLANADLRDVANNLGSLAPAGTFKTLESFRQTEMLGLLNSALQKANTDTLTVGEYTISRTRNIEAGTANLSLYKTVQSGERKELLFFTLQKTDAGLTKQVEKLNISDWDLAQLKFISENAKAFELNHVLENSREQQHSKKSVSEIKVPLHPAIQKAWNQLETQGGSKWHSSIRQENEQIRQNLQYFQGNLSITEQRELYFQILAQQQLDSSTEQIKMPPLKEIMKDLISWRQEAISNKYTPKQHIPMTQEKTASRNSTNSRSKAEMSL
ncbi:MAG: hypothetical protein KME28_26725 [Pelatocladus maniniholoensis HA4357-MV3]|jgi:hypothetical protein|uniref:Uncharacterized protein n=1 Tax=Pelatocladus maniniholoensis HA4357-MV3 TaxID=1117104 RepID=A0A9E3LW32_9NOST|nr:hypothetical protein [Pelatocladus maniniholoensis HA4357-MV3]